MVRDTSYILPDADEFFVRRGLKLEDYYIEHTLVSEMVFFEDGNGRELDLWISTSEQKPMVIARLIQLGVLVVELK